MADSSETERKARARRLVDALRERRPSLMRYLTSRLSDASDAQDVAQDVYLRLVSMPEPEAVENPAAYVFRIAANLANDFHRKKRRYADVVDLETLSERGEDDGNAFVRQMEARSELKQLDAILNELPPLYRSVLLLRKRDGYSHAEIAEQLNISPHTVHMYLKRALSACRAAWTDE